MGRNKKYNQYNLTGDYGIGYCSNNSIEFYFDLEDYDLIKDYTWRINSAGYIVTSIKNSNTCEEIRLHRLIYNQKQSISDEIIIDHKNRNKQDCRKENLRIATKSTNAQNSKKRNDNTSGIIGVIYSKRDKTYCASVKINGKRIELKRSKDIEDCIKARLQAEKEYYGEFAPQQHLFKQYGIE